MAVGQVPWQVSSASHVDDRRRIVDAHPRRCRRLSREGRGGARGRNAARDPLRLEQLDAAARRAARASRRHAPRPRCRRRLDRHARRCARHRGHGPVRSPRAAWRPRRHSSGPGPASPSPKAASAWRSPCAISWPTCARPATCTQQSVLLPQRPLALPASLGARGCRPSCAHGAQVTWDPCTGRTHLAPVCDAGMMSRRRMTRGTDRQAPCHGARHGHEAGSRAERTHAW